MKISEYQLNASKTAVYPEEARIIYPMLGLLGESGEVAEKVKKLIRDKGGVIDDDFKVQLSKEIGDCLWYVSATARDLGIELNGTFESVRELMSDAHSELPELVGKLNALTSSVEQEYQVFIKIIRNQLNEIIETLGAIVEKMDLKLNDIAQANLDKLASRQARGVLQGNGDNR